MTFVVYEQDPLVRYDIIETLISEFADARVEPAEDMRDAVVSSASPDEKKIFIVSLPDGTKQADLDQMLMGTQSAGTVVITNAADGYYRLPQKAFFVQRPFGSDLLIRAVKSVLYDLPGHPS